MASNYPTGLDTFTTGTLTGIVSGSDHGNKADAINKIEAELGASPSGAAATVVARFDSLDSGQIVAPAATGTAATDTAAIQALLDTADSAGATRIILRRGTYAINSLTFPVMDDGSLTLMGQGPAQTILNASAASGWPVTFGDGGGTDTRYQFLENLSLAGNANVDGAVRFNHTRWCGLRRVWMTAFTKAGAIGISILPAVHNYFNIIDHCRIENIPIGVKLAGSGGVGANSNRIRDCHFSSHSTRGVLIDACDGNLIDGCEFNGSIPAGVFIDNDANRNVFLANKFDDGSTTIIVDQSNCDNNAFIANGGTPTYTDNGSGTIRLDSDGSGPGITLPYGRIRNQYTYFGPVVDDTGFGQDSAAVMSMFAGNTTQLQLKNDAGSGETGIFVRRNVGGSFSLQRVTMGATDSGGAGFKLLRVPN